MADVFNTLKQGLGKGVKTVSVKWKEMLNSNRVKSQIADLERQKKEALAIFGTNVCAMLDSGHLDEDALRTARVAMSRFDQQLNEKQAELARIHAEAQQALGMGQPPTERGVATHCTSCGEAIVPGAKFWGAAEARPNVPNA